MKRFLLVTVPVALALLIAFPSLLALGLRLRDSNPVVEGLDEAREEGCLDCHVPIGGQPIANPGSQWGSVPIWAGGVMMMYVSSDSEIVQYIEKGLPDRKRNDAEASKKYGEQQIRMPAFGTRVSKGETRVLAACAKALSGQGAPAEKARDGYGIAVDHGCFDCHGPAGYGGMPNAGSVAGVVAGWAGQGFHDLVRSQEEFGEWVRTGRSKRMDGSPIARFFFARQRVQMPGYAEVLKSEEIEALWEYVRWLRGGPGFAEITGAPGT